MWDGGIISSYRSHIVPITSTATAWITLRAQACSYILPGFRSGRLLRRLLHSRSSWQCCPFRKSYPRIAIAGSGRHLQSKVSRSHQSAPGEEFIGTKLPPDLRSWRSAEEWPELPGDAPWRAALAALKHDVDAPLRFHESRRRFLAESAQPAVARTCSRRTPASLAAARRRLARPREAHRRRGR